MIDVSSEALLTFSEASKALPGRPHVSTLHRWRLRGVRGIKLETCMVGGRRCTSHQAIERFAARTTAVADGEAPASRTSRERKQAQSQAERELDDARI